MENVIWQDNQMAMIVGIQFQVEKDNICQVRQPIIDGFIFEKTFCIELNQKLPARTSWVIKRLIRSSREVRASFLKIIPIQQVALSTLIQNDDPGQACIRFRIRKFLFALLQ